ncbi:MAG: hypothetical protein WCI27_08390 [Candidatus Omnitrophota bacterium]
MKKLLLTIPFLLALVSGVFAADSKTIILKDGSHVKGDLVGIADGYYTITTAAMGDIRVAEKDVLSITSDTPAAQPAAPTDIKATPEFNSIQNKIISDPALLSEIQALLQDPEIMAVMSDPVLIAAVQSGNSAVLQSDPRLKRLSENPKIKALIDKVKPQQ